MNLHNDQVKQLINLSNLAGGPNFVGLVPEAHIPDLVHLHRQNLAGLDTCFGSFHCRPSVLALTSHVGQKKKFQGCSPFQ